MELIKEYLTELKSKDSYGEINIVVDVNDGDLDIKTRKLSDPNADENIKYKSDYEEENLLLVESAIVLGAWYEDDLLFDYPIVNGLVEESLEEYNFNEERYTELIEDIMLNNINYSQDGHTIKKVEVVYDDVVYKVDYNTPDELVKKILLRWDKEYPNENGLTLNK